MRISLVVNGRREDALAAAREAAEWLLARGVTVGSEVEFAERLQLPAFEPNEIAASDLVLSFGGDGTLIRAADICAETGAPILGVYYGSFGFVTQVEGDEIGAALSMALDGAAQIETRMMLQASLMRHGQAIFTAHALNEVTLQRETASHMMVFSVSINGRKITAYPADGVLVATPTGSTAYNLSAGGPIVDPNLRAMILTAIAPHTLSARPLVLDAESVVTLGLQTTGDAMLTVDGQARLHLLDGDEIHIMASPRVTRLVSVERDDFLEKLSHRLFYGVNAISGGLP